MTGVTNLRLEICFVGGFNPRDPALAGETRRGLNDVQCNKIYKHRYLFNKRG